MRCKICKNTFRSPSAKMRQFQMCKDCYRKNENKKEMAGEKQITSQTQEGILENSFDDVDEDSEVITPENLQIGRAHV